MPPSFFSDFKAAFALQSGPLLAAAFTPEPTVEEPHRLVDLHRFTNSVAAEKDIRRCLLNDRDTGVKSLTKQQGTAWLNVVNAYWLAVDEILKASLHGTWWKPLDAWKEFVNQVIRGYSNNHFPAWTIPVLYVAGKYLRAFAIRADACSDAPGFDNGFQEDVISSNGRNANLEDAARTINRMFTLCLGDR
jgi:COP9 signalosome complex subunit 12